MIVNHFKELSDDKKRLFRKRRLKLMKKINLKRKKNGVYLVPFENPVPSEDEVKAIEQIESLIREFHVKTDYFAVTQVELEHWEFPLEDDLVRLKSYFVLKPIKILEE